jgi:WD40 repeat protein
MLLRQRPEELPRAVSLAIDAMKKSLPIGVRTVESDSALRDSLVLLPRLRSSYKYAGHGDLLKNVAFSPDGRYFAVLSPNNALRIYDSVSQSPFGERELLRNLGCDCSVIALSSGLSYAAGVTKGGVKVFDLNDDTGSHFLKLENGVSVSHIALSPGGRYLALSFEEGEDERRLSKMLILETKSGGAIKLFNDLNILISDIEFGPSGNLAIGGKYGPQGFGRVELWSLSLKTSGGSSEPDLTDASFQNVQIVPQQSEVRTVAPGANLTYFATDTGVWKRQPGVMDYSIIARLPYVRDFPSNSFVQKLAFAPDGQTLFVARSIDARDQNQNESDQSVLETWSIPGYQDVAHVFHSTDVSNMGFKPREPFIITITAQTTRQEPAKVFSAVDGKQLESISFEPEPQEKNVKDVSSDGGYIVYADDTVAVVWDLWGKRKWAVPTGNIIRELNVASVSPGGRFLALSGLNKEGERVVIIYRVEGDSYLEWKRILQRGEELDPVAMSISADGSRLAVMYADQSVRVWDATDGYDASPSDLNNAGDVSLMLLSPNGQFVVVTDLDDRTQLLNLSEGRNAKLIPLVENTSITCVAFSSDERYLGLGSDDGTVQIFETFRPDDKIVNLVHTGRITAIAFSNDSRYVATASSDPRPYSLDENESYPVRVWLLQPDDLIAEAQGRLAPFQ